MWCPEWFESAHETLKRKHSKYLAVAAVSAVVLTGLGAVLAPPYIPAPHQLPPEIIPIIDPVQPFVQEPEPPVIQRPEFRPDFEVSPYADPDATIPEAPNIFEEIVPPSFVGEPEIFTALPDQLPVPLHRESPVYPEIPLKAEAEGTVKVAVVVDEDGRVIRVAVYESDATAALEQAALEAAERWLFKPAMQGNVAVRCKIIIPFEFVLN